MTSRNLKTITMGRKSHDGIEYGLEFQVLLEEESHFRIIVFILSQQAQLLRTFGLNCLPMIPLGPKERIVEHTEMWKVYIEYLRDLANWLELEITSRPKE